MGDPARKNEKDVEALRERQRMDEREQWQKEYVARQEFMKFQVEQRRQMRKVPKPIWAIMGVWALGILFVMALFVMSFNPSTKNLVNKIIGAFKVF